MALRDKAWALHHAVAHGEASHAIATYYHGHARLRDATGQWHEGPALLQRLAARAGLLSARTAEQSAGGGNGVTFAVLGPDGAPHLAVVQIWQAGRITHERVYGNVKKQ